MFPVLRYFLILFKIFKITFEIKARCVTSARAFLSGLKDEPGAISDFARDVDHEDYQGENGSIGDLDNEIKINSKLLRFYDYCRKVKNIFLNFFQPFFTSTSSG